MPLQVLAVVVDGRDPCCQAEFWAEALNTEARRRNPGEFQVGDADSAHTPLYFMKVAEPKATKNRLHLDLVTPGSMDTEVARLVELGAHVVEVRQDPADVENPDTWTVMADPEYNECCVTSTLTLTGWAVSR